MCEEQAALLWRIKHNVKPATKDTALVAGKEWWRTGAFYKCKMAGPTKSQKKGTSVSATQVGRLPLHHRACMRRWPEICLCSCIASNLHSGVCEINSRGVKWWPDPPSPPHVILEGQRAQSRQSRVNIGCFFAGRKHSRAHTIATILSSGVRGPHGVGQAQRLFFRRHRTRGHA